MPKSITSVFVAIALLLGGATTGVCAQSTPSSNGDSSNGASQADSLTERPEIERRQQKLLEDYRLLEEKLFTLYQYEKDKNPVRAKLLEKAYQRSQQTATIAKLALASDYLSEAKLKQAETEQANSLTDLNGLLALLQSEDRGKRIRDELERYQEYLKEVERLLRIQKGLRGQAEGAGDPQRIAQSEGQAADRAKKLADEIKKNEETPDPDSNDDEGAASSGEESETESGESGESDGDSSDEDADSNGADSSGEDKQNKEAPGGEKEAGQGGEKDGEAGSAQSDQDAEDAEGGEAKEGGSDQPMGSSESSEGSPSEGQPESGEGGGGEGGESDGEQPQAGEQENPIRKRISNSEDRMRNAQQQLQQGKREKAVDEMKQAEKEIAEAKKQLEEILRQLREEEVERTLAMLEGRFRKMLQQEIEVKDSTEKLNQTADDQRTTDFDIQTGKLSTSQNSIATDASRALLLLREDGSSVAFPVTVEEMHLDMLQIAARLSAAKVGEFTIELQSDVIDTLNYLVDALAQTQQDNEKKKKSDQQPPGGGPPPSPGENALVGKIAELKMLRGLQERIHLQHQRYAKALGDVDQPVVTADTPDLIAGLKRLAGKQLKLTRIAQDIVKESNK